jgi:hypothetical protein
MTTARSFCGPPAKKTGWKEIVRASRDWRRAKKRSCGPPAIGGGLKKDPAGLRRKKVGWKEIVQASGEKKRAGKKSCGPPPNENGLEKDRAAVFFRF